MDTTDFSMTFQGQQYVLDQVGPPHHSHNASFFSPDQTYPSQLRAPNHHLQQYGQSSRGSGSPTPNDMLAMTYSGNFLYDAMNGPYKQENGLRGPKHQTRKTERSLYPFPNPRRQRNRIEMTREHRKRPLSLLKRQENTYSEFQPELVCNEDNTSECGSRVSECCSSCSEGLPCAEPDCEKQKDEVVPCTERSCNRPVCSEPCLPDCVGGQTASWWQETASSSKRVSAWNSSPWDSQGLRTNSQIPPGRRVDPALLNAAESVLTDSGSSVPNTPCFQQHVGTLEQGLPISQDIGISPSSMDLSKSAPIVSGSGAAFCAASWAASPFGNSNFGDVTFNCAWAECQQLFSTQEEWSSHLHQAHVDPQMIFDCPLQSEACTSSISSHPLDHLQAAHGFDFSYNNYSCPAPACLEDETFCNPAMLHNHFDQAHAIPATGQLFCQWNECNSTFADQRELLSHLSEDHRLIYHTKESNLTSGINQAESIPYPISAVAEGALLDSESSCSCQWKLGSNICGAVFETPKELQDHITGIHLKSLNKSSGYYCQWNNCNRKKFRDKAGFSQRGKLIRHMQTHTVLKEEVCDFPGCGRQFSAKQALLQHKRLHTGEKPFRCIHCNRAFAQQSACTMHERTHTGLKPLQCEHCGKRFSESSNLSKHRRMHQEEKEKKSYKCDINGCDKAFVRFASLKNHKQEAHAYIDRCDSSALETD